MKKSKILAAVLLVTMFSGIFTVVNFSSPASGSSESPAAPVATPDALGDPLGTKGIWVQDVTALTITADGDLSDWAATEHAEMNGVDTYLGYDGTNVYVGLTWMDSSNDMALSEWNKTGSATLDNATHGTWNHLDGATDMVAVGFTNSSGYSDIWVWDASLRGDANFAYEVNSTWGADAGDLPFEQNLDVGVLSFWEQPEADNSSVAIPDHDALANGTAYIGWYDDVPTLSQTDVSLDFTWNASGNDMYVVEMIRALDVGSEVDDLLMSGDLSDLVFSVGAANKQDSLDMVVNMADFDVATTNVAAEFSWDIITDDATEALLITGVVWDDYIDFDIGVQLSGWADTYGAGVWGSADFNTFTGDWSYLFYYDEDDMPLGDFQINISFVPKYDAVNDTYQNITIADIQAPAVTGLVDMNDRYPCGVPNGTDYVPVTVGVSDNYQYYIPGLGYSDTDSLIVNLYSWKDDDVALMVPMVQFSPGGSTFSANISLPSIAAGETFNYTYFVQVFDPVNNKVTSTYYWFIHGDICLPTPGFGILAGLFGLAGAAFIIYKKRK